MIFNYETSFLSLRGTKQTRVPGLLRVSTPSQRQLKARFRNSKCMVNFSSCGFTLVELLVTMGIFLLMTVAVLANYKTYGNNAYFANASEDIVLALRQAQVYGVGSKGEGGSFTSAYGVYFVANSSQIIIFRDNDNDGRYSIGDTEAEKIIWKNPITIASIDCNGFPCLGVPQLFVTFKRPSPDALIYGDTAGPFATAAITITNGVKTSKVIINLTGQISLQ